MSTTQAAPPDWGKPEGLVGSGIRRREGDQFLRGEARYINDLMLPGMRYASVLRSSLPHAVIRSIDASAAEQVPGVEMVLTGAQAAEHTGPIPHFIDPAVFGGNRSTVRCLAVDKVIYEGQPVAAVVAQTKADADAALERIYVEYEELPFQLDATDALEEGAPKLYDDWDDNVVMHSSFADGDVASALDTADHVLSDEIYMQRYTTAPLETRGYIADWDDATRQLTFHGACQNPHPLRWVLATALRLDENQVRVVAPKIGGAFGLKMHGHPEETLVAILSMRLGRPVKWIEDRRECFYVGGREQVHRFRVGFNDDGGIVGLENRIVANVGALGAAPGWGMVFLTALSFPTGYAIKNCDVEYTIVATNKAPWNASRGYGKEATNLVMERIIDLVAETTARDPAEVRKRNFIDSFPYVTTGGLNIDSGDYHGLLDKALETVDYDEFRKEQTSARDAGRFLGLGIAFELTPEAADIPGSLVSGFDTTTVKMDPSGNVTVLTGVTSPGGGNDTGIAQIVGEELGVGLDVVRVEQGDTAICPYGFGNYSGRSMVVGGSSAALAARDICEKLRAVAGAMLEVESSQIVLRDGVAIDGDHPDRWVPIVEVAYAVYTLAFATAAMIEPPLESTRSYRPDNIRHLPDDKGHIQPYPTYSNAVHISVVDVDTPTGIVTLQRHIVAHDCGTIINPALVEGQMRGAVVMGLGAALSEELPYGEDGLLRAKSFKTYLMPRATDVPPIEMAHQVTPSPYTLLGAKGAGEAGVGGAQAAAANAIADAIRPLGARPRYMPLSPPEILKTITAAGATQYEEGRAS